MVRIIDEDICYFIPESKFPVIYDQGQHGWCIAFTVSEMNTVVIKMVRKDVDPKLVLSPQVLIDAGATSPCRIYEICCELGLESVTTYPYIEVERDPEVWDDSYYAIRQHDRFCVDDIQYFDDSDEIIVQLVKNFGPEGNKFPIVGAMYMGDMADKHYARQDKNLPYHAKRNVREDDDIEHAVLIIGMNTTFQDPLKYVCKVKNSHGKDWGKRGYSEFVPWSFNYILVPKMGGADTSIPVTVPKMGGADTSIPVTFDPEVLIYVPLPVLQVGDGLQDETIDSLLRDQYLEQLEELRSTDVGGIEVHCWWGLVERAAPRAYDWSVYKRLFQMVQELGFKIKVVMCFHGTTDDIRIPLPQWVLKFGEKNEDIFFTDQTGSCYLECLSWGVDNERVLGDRTPLEVYFYFMSDFRREFDQYIKNEAISMIEIGLGPCGELRYPSNRVGQGWIYSGNGEYQCFDKYLRKSLRNVARRQGYSFCGEPEMVGTKYFLEGGGFDSFRGRFFNTWYSRILIDHGDQVLSQAKLALPKSFITIKLPGIPWSYHTKSHAAELTAGYFNTYCFDGYSEILEMLERHEVGLNFTLAPDSDPVELENSEKLTSQVLNKADECKIRITGGNHLLSLDQFLKQNKHRKNEHSGHQMSYSSVTYRQLGLLLKAHSALDIQA